MDERIAQFRVGVMGLATVLVIGILLLLFGNVRNMIGGSYRIYIKFRSAPGVSVDTPIRKSGIRIGRVTKVEFAPDNDVLITAAIDGGIELFTDEVVQISAGFIGNADLQFVPGARQPEQRVKVQAGDLLLGSTSVDPLQAIANLEQNLNQAASSLAGAGNEIGKLAKSINNMLDKNDNKINQIITDTGTAMQQFEKTLKDIDDVVGDPTIKADLKKSLADLPRLLQDTRDAMTGIQRVGAQAESNLNNLQTFTKALDEQGEGIVNNLAGSVEKLDTLLAQVNIFTRRVNSPEGSLGRMLNDPALYNNLSQAAENINKLTRELQPVVCNAKVFTDKIARHPGVFITDGINPGPGIK
jgi:phospholipid/cholesterol/gamma-HCH transport system substrate-binding protein